MKMRNRTPSPNRSEADQSTGTSSNNVMQGFSDAQESFQTNILNCITKGLQNQEEMIIQQKEIQEELCKLKKNFEDLQTNLEQTNNNVMSSASNAAGGVPKINGDKGKALKELFQEQLPLEDEKSRDDLLEIFKKSSKSVIDAYVMNNDKGFLTWKQVSGPERVKLFNATAIHALESDSRLSFISNCFGKWACEYVLQPQWTQKTKHNRKTL